MEALSRADAILVTRCEQVSEGHLRALESFLAESFPRAWRGRSVRTVEGLRDADGRSTPLRPGARVVAFCALGHSEAFFASLPSLGFEVAHTRRFRDHHRYRPEEIARLRSEAVRLGAEALLTTEKDGVKLAALRDSKVEGPPILELRIRAELPAGEVFSLRPLVP